MTNNLPSPSKRKGESWTTGLDDMMKNMIDFCNTNSGGGKKHQMEIIIRNIPWMNV